MKDALVRGNPRTGQPTSAGVGLACDGRVHRYTTNWGSGVWLSKDSDRVAPHRDSDSLYSFVMKEADLCQKFAPSLTCCVLNILSVRTTKDSMLKLASPSVIISARHPKNPLLSSRHP